MGEDGLADDDLQVVSGERDLENLDPKERAKLEKKRGLIRAGMGIAADDPEDTGFEVAKANGAAMAMLGKRASFAVEGLEVADDREYGSDQVSTSGLLGGILSGCCGCGCMVLQLELLVVPSEYDGCFFRYRVRCVIGFNSV